MASASVSEGDFISALEYLNQAREINDSDPLEYHLYALAYFGKNEPKLAIDAARKAIQLKPGFSAAKTTLGKLLMDEKKYGEAEKYLTESANDLLNRDSGTPKLNLGILNFNQMKYSKSEEWLNKATKDNASLSCVSNFYIGKIRLNQNDLKGAEKSFRLSIKGGCAGLTDGHLAIGQTLVRQKRYDQARAKFVEIQRLFPSTEAYEKASEYLREIP